MPILSFSQELRDYRWKNRILLLCETGEELDRSREQIEMFSPFTREMNDRQLLILVYDGKLLRNADLHPQSVNFEPKRDERFEGVLLIGKDGGVKLKSAFFVDPREIFEIIDSMPMRRAEMKNKGEP